MDFINFIIFLVIGLILALAIEKEYGLLVAIIIAIAWGFYKAPVWGLVAFVELCIGFGLGIKFKDLSKSEEKQLEKARKEHLKKQRSDSDQNPE